MRNAFICLTALCFLPFVSRADAVVGKPAPDFTGTDINGQTHRLSDYKDKIVVLEEYNLDCPFCANHFKTGAMQELQGYATSKGVVWLLVNSVGSRSGSYRKPEQARKEFVAQKMKATAWLDDRAEPEGDPRTARNYVREAIDSLMAGKPVAKTTSKPYGCGVKYGS